jgi:cytochrome c oxidase subunit 1
MIVTTFPWHYAGILGMPRRMAFFDYSDPAIAPEAITVVLSFVGALILVASAVLFFIVLARGTGAQLNPRVASNLAWQCILLVPSRLRSIASDSGSR